MRKRIFCVTIAFLLAVLWTGCEKKAPPLESVRLATGGSTGTYYAYGSALAQVFQKRLGLQVSVQTTAASVANIALLQSGAADFAFVQNDVMTYAYDGTNLFTADGPQKDFSAVAGLYPEVCHIVAAADITDIAELKGKRVSVGEGGSGTSLNAAQVLEAYGMSFADIKEVNLGFGDSALALAAGKIDAFFCTAGTPTLAVSDLAAITPVRLLPIGGARTRLLMASYPYYTAAVIPAGTYPGMTEDVNTVAVQATLAVNNKIRDDDVYKVTKALFESKGEITAAHAKGADLSLESAVSGMPVPIHPGALRYYRETGALK